MYFLKKPCEHIENEGKDKLGPQKRAQKGGGSAVEREEEEEVAKIDKLRRPPGSFREFFVENEKNEKKTAKPIDKS